MLYLSVEDNGKGFEQSTEDSSPSLGLVTMQDYMGAIGGSFTIISVPGQGTKINAFAPLEVQDDQRLIAD